MTSIRRVTSTTDLIPLIPHLVGMPCHDSVVLIPFTGPRTTGALRVNRPRPGSVATARSIARHLTGLLCNLDTAGRLLPVIYAPSRLDIAAQVDTLLLAALVEAGIDAGFDVPDALLIGTDQWASFLDDRTGPTPTVAPDIDGRPLQDPQHDGTLPAHDPNTARLLEQERAAADAAVQRALSATAPTSTIERAITAAAPSATLAAFAAVPALRDLILLQAGWGSEFGHTAWLRTILDPAPLPHDDPAAIALRGGNIRRPDPDRIRATIAVLTATATGASAPERDSIAAMLAWLHWALGASTIAAHLTAGISDHTDPLARIMATITDVGILPDWAWHANPLP